MALRKRTAGPTGSHGAGRPTLAELAERVAALEERLARVEEGRPPPGDGRTTPGPPKRQPRRCLGCGLPLRTRNGRCRWCGRPL